MESLNTATHLISKNCYFASVDLCDAYYSVPIASEHRKYLRVTWKQQMYEFTCLPNGLACAPRLLTKLLKPVYATLHSAGFISVAYIDDSLLISDTAEHCSKNVNETINLLSELGFTIKYEKPVLIPAQSKKILGFIIDSNTMTIRPTSEKLSKLKDMARSLLNNKIPMGYNLASFIGFIVSNFPAVKYGQFHCCNLETNKSNALKANKGNYKGIAYLTQH